MITIKEMMALERVAAKKGVFVSALMDNAGREICRVIKDKFDVQHARVIIFAGTGNNGGDGFAAARYCFETLPCIILFFGEEEQLSEEAKENFDKIKDQITIINIKGKEDLAEFQFQKSHQLVLIDALLGTGIHGKVREPIATGINLFNSLEGIKVAIDLPSGMNADTGKIENKVCEADLIIALHDIKAGLENLKEKTVIIENFAKLTNS